MITGCKDEQIAEGTPIGETTLSFFLRRFNLNSTGTAGFIAIPIASTAYLVVAFRMPFCDGLESDE